MKGYYGRKSEAGASFKITNQKPLKNLQRLVPPSKNLEIHGEMISITLPFITLVWLVQKPDRS